MKIQRSILLIIAVALFAGSCTKRITQPEFGIMAIDSLIGGSGFTCEIEYRFATITNATASSALEAIQQANIGYFFELEAFSGTAPEAAATAIRQASEEMMPPTTTPEATARPGWQGQISVESEGSVVDTLLCYVINRSSYTGGAHCIYGTECHVYSLSDGFEISLVDLFSEDQLKHLDQLIRNDIYAQYAAKNDDELKEKGFFPEYIRASENFLITPEGITFFYNPYEIGCYALGAVEVTIDRETLSAR